MEFHEKIRDQLSNDAVEEMLFPAEGEYETDGVDQIYSARVPRKNPEIQELPDEFVDIDVNEVPSIATTVWDHSAVVGDVYGRELAYGGLEQDPYEGLRLMDDLEQAYRAGNDVGVTLPNNIRDTVHNLYGADRSKQILDGLNDLGEELDIYSVDIPDKWQYMSGDARIAAAADDLVQSGETTLVVTNDYDFKELEEDYNIVSAPAGLARTILEQQEVL